MTVNTLIIWGSCGLVLMGAFMTWTYWRYFHSIRRNWQLLAYGGGTPIPLTGKSRHDAVTWCADHHGVVKYVDVANGLIFYKPKA